MAIFVSLKRFHLAIVLFGGLTFLSGQPLLAGTLDNQTVSQNSLKFLSDVASGPSTWVVIGDSIAYGTGAMSFSTSWSYQVVDQIQRLGNYYGGSGFCSTEGSASCVGVATGTWTPLQGAGPSQTIVQTFGETKTGAAGAKWTTGGYNGTIVDVLYYSNAQTTSHACSISIDGGAAVSVGGSTSALTAHIYTVSGLSNFAIHTVVVTSDGTCNLYGTNFRNAIGLEIWNTSRGGATTAAFSMPTQLSWLSLVPNLAGIVVELGQNDPGSLDQTQSLTNIQAIVSYNQSLPNPVPILFLYPEAPAVDGGQGALYSATQSMIATPSGYDSLSIYNLWGANSYTALPNLYVGGNDVIHPSQAGHNSIASALLSFLGVAPSIDANSSSILSYGAILGEKDDFGNTVSIASVTNGNQISLGGAYASQVNIGTGGASGPAALQILNNGHIAIAPSSAPPVAANCGKSPAVKGNDVKGEITEGTAARSCQLNFGTPYPTAPSCVVSMQLGNVAYSISTSGILVTNGLLTPAGKINYICF